MCSETCSSTKDDIEVRQTWGLENAGTETDEEEPVEFVRGRGRCRSLPYDARGSKTKPTFHKSKTARRTTLSVGSSLENRMEEWQRSSLVDMKGERAAKKYTEMVKDDTLKHLRKSIIVATSVVDKGADINEELRRQEHVLRNADMDISFTEEETNETAQKLRGMTSLNGKLMSAMRKKKPKIRSQMYNDFDLLDGELGLCSLSRHYSGVSKPQYRGSLKDTKEQQIKAGFGDLHKALDAITTQQFDAAWTLDRQKNHLSVLEKKLDSTHTKITTQNQVMSSIMGK